jgi:hypothetical protein
MGVLSHVRVLEVTEEPDLTGACLSEALGVQPLGLLDLVLAVALDGRRIADSFGCPRRAAFNVCASACMLKSKELVHSGRPVPSSR